MTLCTRSLLVSCSLPCLWPYLTCPADPAMPFEWNGDGDEPAMVITHRGHRPRHGIPNHFPFFPGGPRDPLGGTSALSNTPASALQPLAVIISQLDSQMEAVLFSNNRTNPLPVPEYRGSYRSHRPGPTPRGNDDGTNPLLQRASGSRGSDSGIHSLARSRGDNLFDMGLTRPIPFGENPASLLNDIITSLPLPGNLARNGQAIHFQFTNGPRGVIGRDIPAMFGMTQTVPRYDGRGSNVEPGHAAFFTPQLTATRWSEEAKLLFGPAHPDKALPVIMSLMAAIVPAALKEEIKANQERKAAEERKKREEEERLEKQKKEAEEKAAKEKKEAEEREAAEKARAEEVAASAAAENNEENQVEETDTEAMEGVVVETGATASLEDVPAADRPRVTTEIRGAIIDITDLGIDPEFLQELPEDIREEVITAAVAERRSQQAASGAQPSEIDQEFLDALPDEIRDEIMQQERQDRRRREREEARRQAVANGGPAIVVPQEMDAASILATLPPELRAQVLAEQDDDVLAQLPPEYVAQARAAMREHPLSHVRQMATFGGRARPPTAGGTDQASAKQPRRSIVQMLDKPGVATLLRLMFIFQQDSLRNSLFHVLQNISENRHNRAEVISTLLHILQDGSADMTAVERSFAHLSLRAKQPKDKEKEPKTPQLKRTLTGATSTSLITNTEISPLMVVQQCLSALIYLCKVNPHIPSFFLSEHESSTSGLKRSLSRKGKAKESRAAKFALNSLLSLLDRKLIMESSPVMESLSDLLSRITAPLQALERKQKEAAEEVSKAAQAAVEPQAVAVEATADATLTIGSTDAMDTTEPSTATPATETTSAPAVDDAETSTVNADAAEPQASAGKEPEPKKTRPFQAPIVPDANLKLVINIFVARECSAKTFRETLSTIKNLSCIPDAKAVFGRELIRKAQELGEVILGDLEELLPQIQKASTGTEIQGVALTKFSPSGSDQNKLLRVLTALDHLFEPKHSVKRDGEGGTEGESISDKDTEKQDLLASLYENSTFGPMWDKLSACLSAIRQREHMLNVATILLPLIESLMVVCKNTTLKEQPATRTGKDKLLMSPVPESRMENLFFTFTEEHRKILNDLVRNTPKLMSGTFSLLVKNPKVLEFDNKRNYFTRSIHNRNNPSRQSYPPLQISVQRKKVFHDSFRSLYFKTAEEMKYGKLSIRFHGEEGVDAGGVTREWFQVLSRQMFDPDYALFIPVSSDRTTFHPNLMSGINDEHLLFFKFIGRVIGKALYEGRVLDCHFSRPVYKRILGKPVSIKDMESLDPEYYKSLVWMLENDITDIITETFSADNDKFGAVETVDLIENGRNIPVTQENKHEYVRLMVEFKLTGSVQEQLDNFLKGK
jgi:E3 ubiquitin-protein ligase HUWE1